MIILTVVDVFVLFLAVAIRSAEQKKMSYWFASIAIAPLFFLYAFHDLYYYSQDRPIKMVTAQMQIFHTIILFIMNSFIVLLQKALISARNNSTMSDNDRRE